MTNIENAWASLMAWGASYGASDQLIFAVLFAAVLEVIWLLHNGVLYAAHRNGWWKQYKIHPGDQYPDAKLVREMIQDNLVSGIGLRWLALYFLYPLFTYSGMSMAAKDLPSASTFLWQLAVFVAVDDTYFYWGHRLLHTRYLYSRIHKQHHRMQIAVGLGVEYCHPLEDLLCNSTSVLLGPALLGAHGSMFILYAALKMHQSIEAHSGYVFPFPLSIWSLGDQMENGRHEFHHAHNTGCYGGVFCFWDWAMGTDKPFEDWRARRAKLGIEATVPTNNRKKCSAQ